MDKYNSEGYHDPTAYSGLIGRVTEELEQEKKIKTMMQIIRKVAQLAGFEIVGRITFKDKKGKEYR